jgi:hypothetical protein
VAVAVNCCVVPATILGALGVIAMVVRLFGATLAVTVKDVVPVTPLSEAVTGVDPPETPKARPDVLIVATAGLPVAQVAVALTLAVDPSL